MGSLFLISELCLINLVVLILLEQFYQIDIIQVHTIVAV